MVTEVRLYNDKGTLVHTLPMGGNIVTAMRFGFHRESNTLGRLQNRVVALQVLRRKASLEVIRHPVPLPNKMSRCKFLRRRTLRRTNSARARQVTKCTACFNDLCKLRLGTSRAYVKIISDGQGPLSFSSSSSLRLSAGTSLGPLFKVQSMQNMGQKR